MAEEFKIDLIVDAKQAETKIKETERQISNFANTAKKNAKVNLRVTIAKLQSDLERARKELTKFKKEGDKAGELKMRLKIQGLQQSVSNAKKTLKGLDKVVDKSKKKFKSFGQTMGTFIPIALITGAIYKIGKAMFSLGSDLEEITSKFNVVFKGMEVEAKNAFDQIAESAGRSKLEMMEFGSNLGDVLKPLGFATEDALLLSKNMTQLAVDVASFNNVSDTQAINAFRSALTGEREALKTLGIVINEADLKQEAYTSGMVKQGQQLNKTQKAMATYQLLLKNSSDAQGDAVRTANSFANSLKRLKGSIKDTFAGAGKDVAQSSAGMLNKLATFVTAYGKSIATSVIETTKAIGSIIGEAMKGFDILFSELRGQSKKTADEQTSNAEASGQTFIRIMHGIRTVLNGFVFAIRTVGNVFGGAINGMVILAVDGAELITTTFKAIPNILIGVFKAIPSIVGNSVKKSANKVIGGINKLLNQVNKIKGVNFNLLDSVQVEEVQGFGSVFEKEFDRIRKSSDKLKYNLGANNKETIDIISKEWGDLKDNTLDSYQEMENGFVKSSQTMKDEANKTGSAFDDITDLFEKYSKAQEKAGKSGAGGSKEAKNAMKAYEKAIKDTEKATKNLADNSKKYYDDIGKKIDEAKTKQKDLKESLEKGTFKEKETKELVSAGAERDVELKKEEKDVRTEIQSVREQEEVDQEKINELNEQLNKILKERQEIQSFVKETGTEKEFEKEKTTAETKAGSSEFGLAKLEYDEKIALKKKEIQEEIAKQQAILDIQETFHDLQNAKGKEAYEKRKALNELVAEMDNIDPEERKEKLLELGFAELTAEQEIELLKQAERFKALELEKREIEKQNKKILNIKTQYFNLAEEAHRESTDAMIKQTDELISRINDAIQAQLRLRALGGSPVPVVGATSNTTNVNVTNNNASGVDADAAMLRLVDKIN